jgi:hypothetical protein
MKAGDLVHNVPYDTFGVITSELEPIADEEGTVIERRFMVLYNKPLNGNDRWGGDDLHVLTGSTYLSPTERLCHRHHADQKREGERCC